MRRLILFAAAALIAISALTPAAGADVRSKRRRPAPGAPPAPITAYEKSFRQLAGLSPDPSRVAAVRGLTLRRDAGTFEFEEGELSLCRPIEGRVWGAVFVGDGRFHFRPPTQVERDQLRRFHDTDSLVGRFDGLVLIFADSTEQELNSKLSFALGTVPERAPKFISTCLDLLLDKDNVEFLDVSLGKTFLDGMTNGLFLACGEPSKGSKPVVFEIDPFRTEQVLLWRPVKQFFLQGHIRNREVVCQFPLGADLARARAALRDWIPTVESRHVRIDARFDGGLDLSAEAEMRLRSLEEGQRWIPFQLDPELVVDSVAWEGGRRAEFFKGEDASWLWVRCDSALAFGEERTIRIRYSGDLVERRDDWVYFDPVTAWYPRADREARTTFDLTYHIPEQYKIASVGDSVASSSKDGVLTSRWSVPEPIHQASFMVGVYDEYRTGRENIPPVTVLIAESAHRAVRGQGDESLIEQGLAPGKAMQKQVGTDVMNSLSFFGSTYGPTALKRFYAVENPLAPGLLGVAFPGLIHLYWKTFYNTTTEGSDEMLRAHEVAHQWWGALGVSPATYHDQWLSESFAEFSALCYLQAASGNNERFFDILEKSRDRILRNRKFVLGSGQEAGPIWLGARNYSSSTPEDYRIVVYDKGAWVLHMLRNLFLDLDTMKDAGFGAVMREFYTTYASRDATTADFQRIVEKHARQDMAWFFHEWVYGTGIPHYRFSYRVAAAEGGKFKVTCRVDQENVPEDFQMYVPIHLDFGGDRYSKVRVFVKGRHSEFDLPLVPERPVRVVFNDLESVLCEVKNVKW